MEYNWISNGVFGAIFVVLRMWYKPLIERKTKTLVEKKLNNKKK